MSGILEKTIESLDSLFSPLGTDLGLKNMLQRCINARTKREEELIIREYLKLVKAKLSEPSIKPSIITRCLVFSIFSELLGLRTEFAYIHAVKLAQNGSLTEKKLGDKNMFVVAMALSASCHLVPPDQATVLLPILEEKLCHTNEYIRSKAVIALHHFFRISPQLCHPYVNRVKLLLGDKDPGVVAYVLQFILEVAQSLTLLTYWVLTIIRFLQDTPHVVMDIIPALVKIQHQILDGRLPEEFKYSGLNAPWMQISIIRLLQNSSEPNGDIYMVLQKTLHVTKSKTEIVIGAALVYECVATLVHHKAGDEVLASSLLYVADLMSSANSDLSYAGLCLLEMVLRQYKLPLSASQQEVVLSGLRHPDEVMKRRTLSLLCTVAEAHNAQTICNQVAEYVRNECANNFHLQKELVERAMALTDKFPNHKTHWHIAMLIQLLPLGQHKQSRAIQRRIQLSLLAGNGGAESTAAARSKVLHILGKYSESKTVSTSVLEVYVWALSQFCQGSAEVMEKLVVLGRKVVRNHDPSISVSPGIRNLMVCIVHALNHVAEKTGIIITSLEEFLMEVSNSPIGDAYLRLACKEVLTSLPFMSEIHQVLQRSEQTDKLDFTLSFLDKYVCENLENNGMPYQPKFLHAVTSVIERLDPVATTPGAASAMSLPSPCPSPVSSGTGSIVDFPRSESYSSEDSKSWSLRSPRRESSSSKPVWSKEGRARDVEFQKTTLVSSDSEMQHLANLLFTVQEEESQRDSLDDLLHRDFNKLSVIKSTKS
ncbi:hypothetical protein C0J52_08244 [Blattella germanica]|nr:hypothetical protein C0J52_08244 [Blattella germanica]